MPKKVTKKVSCKNKRLERDFMTLIQSDHKASIIKRGCLNNIVVEFSGPAGTPYEGGMWNIHVHLPRDYPFKSPSIGFLNKMYHPNIELSSGSVCLDVINQAWTPLYDLTNVFDCFLPQLLTYPNPTDPLNTEAASLYLSDQDSFAEKVKEYVRLYASTPFDPQPMSGVSSGDESSMSD